MNPVGDVQLNEERRADAYNEASLKKEIRFFPNPPWKFSSFLNVRDHQSSSLVPTDSTTACYWQAKIRWTKTWRRGKTGACRRRGSRRGKEEGTGWGCPRRSRTPVVLHRPASRHSWYGTLSPVFSWGWKVGERRALRGTSLHELLFEGPGMRKSALQEKFCVSVEVLRTKF